MNHTTRPTLTLQWDHIFSSESLLHAAFYQVALADDFPHVHVASWKTRTREIDVADSEVVLHVHRRRSQDALLRMGEQLVHVSLGDGEVEAHVASRRSETPVAVFARLRAAIPEESGTGDDGVVPVTFWSWGADGPASTSRQLAVPSWNEIRLNYSTGTRRVVETLVRGFSPAASGQLLLWTGEPGTGKTHAVRALAREWRAWCCLHYITDPERFLGGSSRSLFRILLEEDETEDDPDAAADRAHRTASRWRLLLMEDTGEMLSADAKERVGQGLSRLLNVVDGLIGQGLRILVMITTNEDVGTLHPAVSRPGRCALLHEFDRLSVDEANAWLCARGARATVTRPTTIAELYAILAGRAGTRTTRAIGFDGSGRTEG